MTKQERIKLKESKIEEYNRKVINYNRVVSFELSNRNKTKKATDCSYVSIQNLNKIYDNLVQAVYDFNLDIYKNEFIVFVGPSGCGKSTTLRMIAGLEEITAGNLFIDGEYANNLPPKDRNVAMVFQNYALYPHMSVFKNMAFSLLIKAQRMPKLDNNGKQIFDIDIEALNKANEQLSKLQRNLELASKYNFTNDSYEYVVKPIELDIKNVEKEIEIIKNKKVPVYEYRKMSKDEIYKEVYETSKILQLDEYLDRKPKALSGGQRQRVALGRAIVKKSKLFLMDEPLSNLDAKLRVSMRAEIKNIHKSIGATTIYVTHDQIEAMTMADRIVVMNKGVIQQIGTPKEIYNSPNNKFVATFIGTPSMNIFEVHVKDGFIHFNELTSLKIKEEQFDLIKRYFENEIQKINVFESNGLKQEYEKQLMVKKETLALSILNGTYKSAKDANGNTIDPLTNLELDSQEKLICQSLFNSKMSNLNERRKIYESMLKDNDFHLYLGIRSEDVHFADELILSSVMPSNNLNVSISLCELLGNEYYVHSSIGDSKFILKSLAQNEINENTTYQIFFDLNKMYFFNFVDENVIK